MSHFSVMVVTPGKPGEAEIARALAPFHEFECTGVDDEFVRRVDLLPEARDLYEKDLTRRLVDPDGNRHDPYDDRFYRDPTEEERRKIGPIGGTGSCGEFSYASKDWGDGKGYRAKVHFVPNSWKEVQVKTSEIVPFDVFVADYYGLEGVNGKRSPDLKKRHKYGWYRRDAAGAVTEVVKRTNPNKKWDWWVIGGRWRGFLIDGSGTNGADSLRKGDVDFAAKEATKRLEAEALWDRVRRATGSSIEELVRWPEALARFPKQVDKARAFYHDQEPIRSLRAAGKNEPDLAWIDADEFVAPRTEYVRRCVRGAFATFAFLRGDVWSERGHMGWWGAVHEEKENWHDTFHRLLADVPDDHWLTIVDCHI